MSWRCSKPAGSGFSLVELMVAVCILSVGIVGVLRSFLSAASALDHLNSRFAALVWLDTGFARWQEAGGDDEIFTSGPRFMAGGRKAVLGQEVSAWRRDDRQTGLSRVLLSVVWKEGVVSRDEVLGFLVHEKE